MSQIVARQPTLWANQDPKVTQEHILRQLDAVADKREALEAQLAVVDTERDRLIREANNAGCSQREITRRARTYRVLVRAVITPTGS